MTKAEVANLLMEKTGLGRAESYQAVEVFLDSIKESLQQGDKVSLVGFGTFLVKAKNARNGRNPRTGEQIFIEQKNVVVFKPGKSFRESVNDLDAKPSS
ncbi:MAG: DNA-binding protein HU-beta [Candidatus Sumerlaeota bacterium]|jgi:DNA-binding protein HU-beta|nr:DNA-binding protein HU-beta [Candidatus Sumerlaeota bacterium]